VVFVFERNARLQRPAPGKVVDGSAFDFFALPGRGERTAMSMGGALAAQTCGLRWRRHGRVHSPNGGRASIS